MSLRITLLEIFLFISTAVFCQVKEDFSDNDLSHNPQWSGDLSSFQIVGGQLNSLGPAATAELYLSTPNEFVDNTTWQFFVQINGTAPSGSNRVRIYLMSDAANLEATINGYYMEIGQTGDDFLNLKSTASTTPVITGTHVFATQVRVKVERSAAGEWKLSADHTGGNNFSLEGTATDLTFTQSSFFGLVVNHTSTRNDDFFFDDFLVSKTLELEQVEIKSATEIALHFNQPVKAAEVPDVLNYQITSENSGPINAQSADRDELDHSLITLTVDELSSDSYQITIQNLQDSVLSLAQGVTGTFVYRKLELSSSRTLSSTEVELVFNDAVSKSVAEIATNYSLDQGFGNPTLVTRDASNPKLLKLTFGQSFQEGVDYSLSISDIQNESGNSIFSGNTTFVFKTPILISSFKVLNKQQIQIIFNKILDETTAENVSNYHFKYDEFPAFANAAELQSDGKTVIIDMAETLANHDYELTISGLTDADGQTLDEPITYYFSYLPLEITSAVQEGDFGIRVKFNQPIDFAIAGSPANFQLDELGNPDEADRDAVLLNEVLLTYSHLTNNNYALRVLYMTNESGNAEIGSEYSSFEVAVRKSVTYQYLRINEVMADPTPSHGLPEAEYVELYNGGDYSINLIDFLLNGKKLNSYRIQPDSYVLLADQSNISSFGLTNVLGVSGFDALTNGGDFVRLHDGFGNVIDSITYTLSWYQDASKQDGGYSLELIDPEKNCYDVSNWKASIATKGGTPGAQNSIYNTLDNTPPSVVGVKATAAQQLLVEFSESLDFSTVQVDDFSLSDLSVTDVSRVNSHQLYLELSEALISENYYTLGVSGIADCKSNEQTNQQFRFYYDITPPRLLEVKPIAVNELALIFSESLNETPAETEANFLLKDYTITQALLQDSASNRVHLQLGRDLMLDSAHSLTVVNMKDSLGNLLLSAEVEFLYENQVDTSYVIAPNLLALKLKEEPIRSTAENPVNYILKSTGQNPVEVAQDNSDKLLFRLAFAQNFKENTSLQLYISNLFSKAETSRLVTPAATFQYDTRAANILSIQVKNDSQVVVTWNEPMDLKTATSSAYYSLENGEQPVKIERINSAEYELTFANKFLMEVTKTLSVRGVKDQSGVEVTTTRKVTFVYDIRPPQVLDLRVTAAQKVKITFSESLEKLSATSADHYLLAGVHPETIQIFGPDSISVELGFTAWEETDSLLLVLNGISDRHGNVLVSDSLQLNTAKPEISEVSFLNDYSVKISFNQAMGTSVFDYFHFETTQNAISQITKISDSQVKLIFSELFLPSQNLQFGLKNITDSQGRSLMDTTLNVVFDTYFVNASVIDENTLELTFDTEFSSILKSQFTLTDNEILLANIDGEEKGIVRLLLKNGLTSDQKFTLSWKALTDLYGRNLPDYHAQIYIDQISPELDTLQSEFFQKLKLTFSEPMNAKSVLSLNHFYISGIGQPNAISALNDSTILMDYIGKVQERSEYQLIISPLADLAGNYSLADTISFTYQPPLLPNYRELVINEIMADPTPVIALPEVEYLEIYNLSDQTFDLKGVQLKVGETSVALPSYQLTSGAYLLLVDEGDQKLFSMNNVLEINLPALGNMGATVQLLTIKGELIDKVSYDLSWYADTQKDDGGYSLEQIDPLGACLPKYNWKSSNSTSGGTPGMENSVYRIGQDFQSPVISKVEVVSSEQLQLTFSDPMDSTSLADLEIANDLLEVEKMKVLEATFTAVQVNWKNPMEIGILYDLVISKAQDCTGTVMKDTTISIGIGKQPLAGDLIFTEIMADPDPVVGLPNSEFVEIFNKSNTMLDLSEVTFKDATSGRKLPKAQMLPGEYVILCPASQEVAYPAFGRVIALSSWPALTNSGENLSLETTEIVDAITYSVDWFTNQEKANGGYSLELVNPQSPCPGSTNWRETADEKGGTPGQQNSVYDLNPDQIPPVVLSMQLLGLDTLVFTFSEAMNEESLMTAEISGVSEKERIASGELSEILTVFLEQPLVKGELIQVSIASAKDCSGNVLISQSFEIGVGDIPHFNELLITEIMADPDPVIDLPNSEYLEIYNASERLLSLGQVKLSDETGSTSLPNVTLRKGEYLLLLPTSAVSAFQTVSNKVGVSGWRSLTNAGEPLRLYSEQGIIFEITYNDSWHDTAEKAEGGVSLEMKDLSNPCTERLNWGSATALAGGTPGKPNSNRQTVSDQFGPNVIDAFLLAPDTVVLLFDELLDYEAVDFMQFTISPEITVSSAMFGSSRKEIYVHFSSELVKNQPYEMTLGNLTDCNGNFIQNNQITVVRPDEALPGEVVLNELLFNPKTGGVDFVEVFNNSEKYFQLQNWKVARRTDELESKTIGTSYLLAPQSYLAITTDTLIVKTQYPLGSRKKLLEVASLPTMSNESGIVVLLNEKDTIMDEFEYDEDMHLSLLESMDGVSLERISTTATTQDANNWSSASSAVGFATPGYANSQSYDIRPATATLEVAPKVFVPGSASSAYESFTTINYQLDKSGQFANVTIYNQNGISVAKLAQGQTLSTNGFFRWDGTNAAGERVRLGYYIVLFEIYDGAGHQQVLKETVVVGR